MPKPKFDPNVPILWGDNDHDDSAVIRHLFNGGVAYHARSASMISAPTLEHLPPGTYRTVPSKVPAMGASVTSPRV